MKIQVLGDLHLPRKGFQVEINPEADVMVIAGDLITVARNKEVKKLFNSIRTRSEIPIIYILGNHDYYERDSEGVAESYRKISDRFENIHLLNQDTIQLGGVTFVGCTLWSKLNSYKDMVSAKNGINDFRSIKIEGRRITPDDYNDFHDNDRYWIEGRLFSTREDRPPSLCLDTPLVVVTHHAPSWNCVSEEFKGSSLNPCFVNDLDSLIYDYYPNLWIHGHTHQFLDFKIDNTRVVNNPLGYTFEDTGFQPTFIVEI